MFAKRIAELRRRLSAAGYDTAFITDDDSVYYLTGYYDYLHMEFGRPTILIVPVEGDTLLITPTMEAHMAQAAARVDRLAFWNDGLGEEWRAELPGAMAGRTRIAYEPDRMPPLVRAWFDAHVETERQGDVSDILATMRMVKSPEELQLARHAGEVATAMMAAARDAIGDGVAEYEVALAVSAAGTRKAATLLTAHYDDTCMSPATHFLQIMASGDEIVKPHHRASTRIMRSGEPVFICLCGMTNFHRFKLGFDRTFWIDNITNPRQREVYEVALVSQQAALDALRPGVTAASVHAAYADVIQQAGFDDPFRCGRATGFSFHEKPQLVTGDETTIAPGMVFAVDGSVTDGASFRAQVGDSFIVTDDGWERITNHPNAIEDVILT